MLRRTFQIVTSHLPVFAEHALARWVYQTPRWFRFAWRRLDLPEPCLSHKRHWFSRMRRRPREEEA